MINTLLVGLGGAIGAMARYGIALLPLKEPYAFPLKTFIVNIIGCFAIGCIVALSIRTQNLSPRAILFLKTGICGGFTTYSTFALETTNLFKTDNYGIAIAYVVLSLVIGIGAIYFAQWSINKM